MEKKDWKYINQEKQNKLERKIFEIFIDIQIS